jgi:hypothetical protein
MFLGIVFSLTGFKVTIHWVSSLKIWLLGLEELGMSRLLEKNKKYHFYHI